MEKINRARHTRGGIATAVESLESRRLFAAAVPTFVAIADVSQTVASGSNTLRSISYYDVTALNTPAGATEVFDKTPLFSVWTGYEITNADPDTTALRRNFEEISAFDIDPATGDTFQLAFDSGPVGVPDNVGDTQGDYDLYRFNFARIYNDFVTNNRPRGVMYTDAIAPDGFNYLQAYGSARPAVSGENVVDQTADVGVPPARSNEDNLASNDIIFLDGAVDKIGEMARVQNARFFGETGTSPTGDNVSGQDLQFVDSSTLLVFENTNNPAGEPDPEDQVLDYQVRVFERVATTPGSAPDATPVTATTSADDLIGGYDPVTTGVAQPNYPAANLPLTTESWRSDVLDTNPDPEVESGGLFVNLDPGSVTDADGMRYVNRNGVQGVWVTDRDGTGADFAFYELNLDPEDFTAARREVVPEPTPDNPAPEPLLGFSLSEQPEAAFFPTEEAGNAGDLDWFDVDEFGNLIISESGFNDTTQTEPKVIIGRVQNYDAGNTDGNTLEEIDLGAFTTQPPIAPTVDDDADVTNSINGVFERDNNHVYYFDLDGGVGTADVYVYDIDTRALVYQELDAISPGFLDDANLMRTFTFVRGDANGDGRVNLADFGVLRANFGGANRSFAHGNFDGTGTVNLADFGILRQNFGYARPSTPPPAPTTASVASTVLSAGTAGEGDSRDKGDKASVLA